MLRPTTIARRFGWLGAVASAYIALTGAPAMADETIVPFAAMPYPQNPTTATTRSWDIGFVDTALNYYLLADRGVKGQTGGFIDVYDTNSLTLSAQLPGFIGNVSKVTAPKGTLTFNGCPGAQTNPPTSCDASTEGAVKSVSGPNGTMSIMHRYAVGGDGNSTVKILSFTGGLVANIPITGGLYRADEMCFDPTHGLMMVTNDAEDPWPFTTIISLRGFTQTQVVFSQANFTAAPGGANSIGAVAGAEQCQWNPRTNEFWHAIPQCYSGTINSSGVASGNGSGNGCVVTISTTGVITNLFPVPCNPNGLAIGPGGQIGLGCQANPNGTTYIIFDGTSGSTRGSVAMLWSCAPALNGCSGNDEIDFNATTGHYYMADGTGAFPPGGTSTQGAIHVIDSGVPVEFGEGGLTTDPDAPDCTGTVVCGGGNHSVAGDSVHNYVFVPIREATSGTGGICSTFSGGAIPDAAGCIGVFTDPGH